MKKTDELNIDIKRQGRPSPNVLDLRNKQKGGFFNDESIKELFGTKGTSNSKDRISVDFINDSSRDDQEPEEADMDTLETAVAENIFEDPEEAGDVKFAGFPFKGGFVFLFSAALAVIVFFVARDVGIFSSVRGKVLGAAETGVHELEKGILESESLDFQQAHLSFTLAQSSFADALSNFSNLESEAGLFARILPYKYLAKNALLAANELARAGRTASATGEGLKYIQTKSAPFVILEERVSSIKSNLGQAKKHLDSVPNLILFSSQKTELAKLKNKINSSFKQVGLFSGALSFLNKVFGGDGPKRYLVFFQNDAELRATGGFWGSFAVVDFQDGAIKNLEIPDEGTYALQGSLTKRVAPPLPLAYLRDRWEFQDANWYFDFKKSCEQAIDFYTHSGGSTVDGVIAINASLLPELLRLTGPITLADDHKILNERNVLFEVQRDIELSEHKDEGPKAILSELGFEVLKKLFSLPAEEIPKLAEMFIGALNNGSMQMMLRDLDLADQAAELGWDGAIPETTGDFLAIVDTNIAGGKTDSVIDEKVSQNITILNEGSVIDEINLARLHSGSKNQGPFIGVRNRDFVRFYFSPNTKLVETKGLSREPDLERKAASDLQTPDGFIWSDDMSAYLGSESGKLVVSGWVITDPGEESNVTLRVINPKLINSNPRSGLLSNILNIFNFKDKIFSYHLYYKPQSGQRDGVYDLNIIAPKEWKLLQASVNGKVFESNNNSIAINGNLKEQRDVILFFSSNDTS